MKRSFLIPPYLVVSAVVGAAAANAQGSDLEARVQRLELENKELKTRIDVLGEESERLTFGDVFVPIGASRPGLGPAASKIYNKNQGLSIGGYGEAVYSNPNGKGSSEFDALRTVLYFGYKFDENWLFNSEIEFEHGSTGENGSVSAEFAYLDWLACEHVALRAGLLLTPMGIVNELHEPTTFLPVGRPETERRILPSTWRENGVGVHGEAGDFAYRAYLMNGFDAMGFSASGLRGGRQAGSEALAEDLALVARTDWSGVAGLVLGASAYFGDAGQNQAGLGDTSTTIVEAHADFRYRGFTVRALVAQAEVDDVAALNAAGGLVGAASVGETLEGHYVELGYDILALIAPESRAAVTPYVRYEGIDTQADVPTGFASSPANDESIVTLGLNVQPIDQVVFKLEFQDWDLANDEVRVSMGFVF